MRRSRDASKAELKTEKTRAKKSPRSSSRSRSGSTQSKSSRKKPRPPPTRPAGVKSYKNRRPQGAHKGPLPPSKKKKVYRKKGGPLPKLPDRSLPEDVVALRSKKDIHKENLRLRNSVNDLTTKLSQSLIQLGRSQELCLVLTDLLNIELSRREFNEELVKQLHIHLGGLVSCLSPMSRQGSDSSVMDELKEPIDEAEAPDGTPMVTRKVSDQSFR